MPDTLTSLDFEPLLDNEFEVSRDGNSVTLILSALDVMEERHSQPGVRQSFSLTFLGPLEPLLPQGIYTLNNEELGSIDLFIVPLGPLENAQRYEIVMN